MEIHVNEKFLESMWKHLKDVNCADPKTGVRIALLSEPGFMKAMRSFFKDRVSENKRLDKNWEDFGLQP